MNRIVEIHFKAESVKECAYKILDKTFFKTAKEILHCVHADDCVNDIAKDVRIFDVKTVGILCVSAVRFTE